MAGADLLKGHLLRGRSAQHVPAEASRCSTYGRDIVAHAAVVEHHRLERRPQRERLEGAAVAVDCRHTAGDVRRPTRHTNTQSTPSRCTPSGVGNPAASAVASIRNWCARPARLITAGTPAAAANVRAHRQQPPERGMAAGGLVHRCKPAVDAPFGGWPSCLVVRLVGSRATRSRTA